MFPVARWDRYEPLGFLGRGGMGAVWKARDRVLGRVVALKFLRGVDPDLTLRFAQEARAQARIEHPGVCKVFEVGEVEGKAYIAMQMVDGERLDRAARTMSLPEKVQAIRDVAQSMHEAHRLGVIHRDLKPANIMVERADDGRLRPVVMDFGLARATGTDIGLTRTGVMLGTPAYMSPEQARGETDMDRRSDVYSLGATLYELLVGRPPFVEDTVLAIVAKVLDEDPPSLRGLQPHLPRDLETIALKCLRKEPEARYDSARALAEDLQRYIDGEAILGARQPLWQRLARSARRHRALVTVSAISLVLVLVAGAFGLRSLLVARAAEHRAAERARLAERLGQDVKEIELFMRLANTLPLHDTTPERMVIRDRMARIAEQEGEGAVQAALGRAHIALHEYDEALESLERARALGVDTPEIHFARGRVLGELYHRALEKARTGGDKAWLAAEQKRLEAKYLVPARDSLEKSRGAALESPRYLVGLLSLYQHDEDAAIRAADDAARETPWLAETHRLGADAAYAKATAALDRGDYDEARAGLQAAIDRYQRACAIARSDDQLYQVLARAWLGQAEVNRRQGRADEQKAAIDAAMAAADSATVVAPRSAAGPATLATALLRLYLSGIKRTDEESAALLERLATTAARAVNLDPSNAPVLDMLGSARFLRGMYEFRHGRDPMSAFRNAIDSYEQAIELEPTFPWAHNDLGSVYLKRAGILERTGGDPLPDYAAAAESFERAVAVDPAYLFAHVNLVEVHGRLAELELRHGRDPADHVRRAASAGERGLAIEPNFFELHVQLASVDLVEAQYLGERHQDPTNAINRAIARLERTKGANKHFGEVQTVRAAAYHHRAKYQLGAGRDPSVALAEGRRAIESAIAKEALCVECRLWAARFGLLEAAWATQQGRTRAAVINEGLTHVERALAQSPDLALGHALRGALLIERGDVADARASFERAFKLDPLLRREFREP